MSLFTDYYLSTTDEATMHSVLALNNFTNEEGNITGVDISIIGIQHERTGGTDEEPVFSPIPGWHFNIHSREPIEWLGDVIQSDPVTPWRVWA